VDWSRRTAPVVIVATVLATGYYASTSGRAIRIVLTASLANSDIMLPAACPTRTKFLTGAA